MGECELILRELRKMNGGAEASDLDGGEEGAA